jgi:hypothetical protein
MADSTSRGHLFTRNRTEEYEDRKHIASMTPSLSRFASCLKEKFSKMRLERVNTDIFWRSHIYANVGAKVFQVMQQARVSYADVITHNIH